ncbi:hypothetical protein GCK72_009524 [Caenorhabditis remanei]|uniref:Uncharacterized protein n=1 Tax=Caenorhabditis remanei TaxID=31234 RepID=A0A6A5H0E8_CAERE|nr:hypothetical protein GCK72_009524 [Caenorhabditis remanei]KAF1761270.1 hypothetical protein GCK72_009524 [Caenorhabditis remanei]
MEYIISEQFQHEPVAGLGPSVVNAISGKATKEIVSMSKHYSYSTLSKTVFIFDSRRNNRPFSISRLSSPSRTSLLACIFSITVKKRPPIIGIISLIVLRDPLLCRNLKQDKNAFARPVAKATTTLPNMFKSSFCCCWMGVESGSNTS